MQDLSLRQQYIDSLQNTPTAQNNIRLALERINALEKEFGVSIENMSENQMHECLTRWDDNSGDRYITLKNALKHYLDWRNRILGRENAPNYIATFQVTADLLLPSFFDEYLNFEDVYRKVVAIYPTTEGHLIYPVLCLLWLGFLPEAALSVRNEDVDIVHNRIFRSSTQKWEDINDRRVSELLGIYQHTLTGLRTQKQTFYVDLIDVGLFLKQAKTKNSKKSPYLTPDHIEQSINRFHAVYQKRIGKLQRITTNNMLLLGIMNRLQAFEESTGADIMSMSPEGLREINPQTPVRWTGAYTKQLYVGYKNKCQQRKDRGDL